MGYPLGAIYRHGLAPSPANVTLRHIVSTSFGLLFGLICFGWVQMGVLFFVTGVCYVMLLVVPSNVIHVYTIVFAMASMSVAHMYRMMVDYGGWHLDFTGPLMLIVQKVTLTAFGLHDGVACQEAELNGDQNLIKFTEAPSLLEYWSYNYNFHTFLAGPTCTLKEYLNFVDGSNFKATTTQIGNRKSEEKSEVKPPVLFGTNSRAVIKGWNVTTSLWLRRVCYDRVPPSFVISPNMAVWLLSAMWHGFYPSYYLTFVCCGFITEAARKMRHFLSHHFQMDPVRKRLYDLITIVTTLFFTGFAVISFQLLFLDKCLQLWRYVDLTMHKWVSGGGDNGGGGVVVVVVVVMVAEDGGENNGDGDGCGVGDAVVCLVCMALNYNPLFSSYFYYLPFVVVVVISGIPARKGTKQFKDRN
ncbi:hypothetical protein EMCRGX_G007967 [Ephydatia muelleri]